MNTLTQDCKIKINPHVNHSVVDNDLIIMGPEDHVSYRVNAVGMFIWALLEAKTLGLKEVALQLQQQYQITQERALQDTMVFAERMLSKNILLVA
ncbi:PqqD family peptide modification chaperone [bacterium]|nr:PqqD family peptide modification chaperone [bacterium]